MQAFIHMHLGILVFVECLK